MATNWLLPFAGGGEGLTRNIIDKESWRLLTQRQTGFQSGIAQSKWFNYILAQGGSAGYCIGQMVADKTSDNATIDAEDLYSSFRKAFLEMTYPVGSIYISANATNPATLFGGVWEQLQNRTLVGAGSNFAAGSTGGSATHTITTAEMPTHTHSASSASAGGQSVTSSSNGGQTITSASAGGQTITSAGGGGTTVNTTSNGAQTVTSANGGSTSVTTNSAGSHTHTRGTMNITGNGGYFETGTPPAGQMQGAFYIDTSSKGWMGSNDTDYDNYRMAFDASRSWTGTTSENGSHSHTVGIPNHTHQVTISNHNHSITLQNHTHTVTVDAHTHQVVTSNHTHTVSVAAHTHGITVENTGSGTAMNIMNPYVVVYMWKRVA